MFVKYALSVVNLLQLPSTNLKHEFLDGNTLESERSRSTLARTTLLIAFIKR